MLWKRLLGLHVSGLIWHLDAAVLKMMQVKSATVR